MDPSNQVAASGRWAHVRAALVLFHVTAVLMLALPTPGEGMRRAAWKDPTVQAEFRAWSDRLRSLGLELDSEQLEERAWRVAQAWVGVRGHLVAPFRPYADLVGARQPWRMFVAPHRYPTALHVELEDGGRWRPLFVERSAEHTWKRRQLEHDRLRAALFRYGWPMYGSQLRRLATWLGRQARHDFPGATRMRVRMVKVRTPSPGEVRAGVAASPRTAQEVIVDLEALP